MDEEHKCWYIHLTTPQYLLSIFLVMLIEDSNDVVCLTYVHQQVLYNFILHAHSHVDFDERP